MRCRSSRAGSLLLIGSLVVLGNGEINAGDPPVCTRLHPAAPDPVALSELRVLESQRVSYQEGGPKHSILLTSDTPVTSSFDSWGRFDVYELLPTAHQGPQVRLLFSLEQTTNEAPPVILSGDVDGDGLTDLLVHHISAGFTGPGRVELYRATPDHRYELGAGLQDTSYFARMVVADVDGDKRDELVLVDCQTATAYRYETSRWGLLTSQAAPRFTQVLAADLDGDGDDDLVGISLQAQRYFSVLFGDPVAPLANAREIPVPFEVYSLAVTFEADRDASAELLLASKIESLHEVTLHALELIDDAPTAQPLWDLALPVGVTWWWPYDIDADGVDELALEFSAVKLYGWGSNGRGCSRTQQHGQGVQIVTLKPDSTPQLAPRSHGTGRLVEIHDVDADGNNEAILVPASGIGLISAPIDDDLALQEPLFYEPQSTGFLLPELVAADLNHDRYGDLLVLHQWGESSASLLGRGDGRYTLDGITPSAHVYLNTYVHDIDGDGNIDLIGCLDDTFANWSIVDVSFGLSNGRRTPFRSKATGQQFLDLSFGDLDGDGDDDMLANAPYDRRYSAWRSPIMVQGQNWTVGPPSIKYNGPTWLIDVDRDGLADPVFVQSADLVSQTQRLVWQRSRPGLRFDPPQQIATWSGSTRELQAILDQDLDGSGARELLLVIDSPSQRTLWTLRREEGLRFRTLARESIATADAGGYRRRDIALADVDHDGHLDLLTHQGDLRFVRGDGSGRFHPPAIVWSADETPEFSDIDGDGWLDGVGRASLGLSRELAVAMTRPITRSQDAAAPTVELRLDPLPRDLDPTPTFDNEWRVTTWYEDDCDAAPGLLRDQLELAEIGEGVPVLFRSAAEHEVRVYRLDGAAQTAAVVLLGSDEAASRALWSLTRSRGGFDLSLHHELQLVVSQEQGATPFVWGDAALLGAGYRLSHRFVLQGEQLRLASASYPSADLTFVAAVQDQAGRTTTERQSLNAARTAYCRNAGSVTLVCSGIGAEPPTD